MYVLERDPRGKFELVTPIVVGGKEVTIPGHGKGGAIDEDE